MPGKRSGFPFRWVLPIGQLLICAIVLWPVRAELIHDLDHSARPPASPLPPVQVGDQKSELRIVQVRTSSKDEQRASEIREARFRIPKYLNFPAFFVDYPFADLFTGPRQQLSDTFIRSWQAITWPLIGIVFWWMVGRAIEALLAATRGFPVPRITAPEVVSAIALIFFGAGLSVIGARDPAHNDLESRFLVRGAALWTIFGATMLAARIAQWRMQKPKVDSNAIANGPPS